MTRTINMLFGLTLLLLFVASGAPAGAQTASSFEQLALLLESGDRVTLTDSSGRERTGRVINLSPSAVGTHSRVWPHLPRRTTGADCGWFGSTRVRLAPSQHAASIPPSPPVTVPTRRVY